MRDGGYATAELAVAMPSFVLFLLAALWVLRLVTQQATCVEAARIGGRAAARGDPVTAVVAVAGRAAPAGAHVSVRRADGLVEVQVTATIRPAGALLAEVPGITLHATSTAADETVPELSPATAAGSVAGGETW